MMEVTFRKQNGSADTTTRRVSAKLQQLADDGSHGEIIRSLCTYSEYSNFMWTLKSPTRITIIIDCIIPKCMCVLLQISQYCFHYRSANDCEQKMGGHC